MRKRSRKLTAAEENAALAEIRAGVKAAVICPQYRISKLAYYKLRTRALSASEPGSPDAPEADGPMVWKLNIEVPVDRLDWFIGNLTLDDAVAALLNLGDSDKCLALEFIVQRRMNQIAKPFSEIDLASLGEHIAALAQPLKTSTEAVQPAI